MATQLNKQTQKKTTFFRSNPVMNGLNKVTDRAGVNDSTATYGGIAIKTTFFILLVIVGVVAYLFTNQLLLSKPEIANDVLQFSYKGFDVAVPKVGLYILGGTAIIGIVTQILACFVQKSIPITGPIFCICQGFFISFLAFTILKGQEYIALLALIITITIVLVMNILYSTKVIKANKKFHMVMFSLFITVIAVSIISTLGYIIPFTHNFFSGIFNNPVISIAITVISIIIASLFLISDFAMIDTVVNERYEKKYEWRAAFGLAFTIIWIYVKVLDLLLQLLGSKKS